jgi:glycosyltransferase involved in cell wall biosynthesis
VVNDADGLLFTCQTELLLARETFRPYRPKKEYNAGYGIQDPPKYTKQMSNAFFEQCPGVQGKPFLLFLSRIHPKKGIRMLLTSYIKLYETLTIPGGNTPRLVIAGPGWDSVYGKKLKEQLMSQASHEARSAIFPVNMLTNDAKWGAFYECEAFVLPSHQENFGIALVEALACGKPGLISNQVNIWVELASEGGGIVENDSDAGTYSMLKKWLEMTPDEKAQMSILAKEVYHKYFTVDQIVQNYLTAFSEQLSKQ